MTCAGKLESPACSVRSYRCSLTVPPLGPLVKSSIRCSLKFQKEVRIDDYSRSARLETDRHQLGLDDRVRRVSPRGRRRPFLFQLAGILHSAWSLLGCFESGNRYGVPSAADASVVSAENMDQVLFGGVRHSGPRRWSDLLGGDAPDSSSVLG